MKKMNSINLTLVEFVYILIKKIQKNYKTQKYKKKVKIENYKKEEFAKLRIYFSHQNWLRMIWG